MTALSGAPPINSTLDQIEAGIIAVCLGYGVLSGSVALLVAGSVLLIHLAAARSDYSRYSIFDTGRYDRLQNRAAGTTTEPCADCDAVADGGERRARFTELVLGGIVLARYDEAVRYYCRDHADIAVAHGFADQQTASVTDSVELATLRE